MSGGAKIFKLFASEDIDGNKMDLSVAMLAGLRGAHFHDFAGATLDHNESVFAKSGALHGVSSRGASVGALERVLMLLFTLISFT